MITILKLINTPFPHKFTIYFLMRAPKIYFLNISLVLNTELLTIVIMPIH